MTDDPTQGTHTPNRRGRVGSGPTGSGGVGSQYGIHITTAVTKLNEPAANEGEIDRNAHPPSFQGFSAGLGWQLRTSQSGRGVQITKLLFFYHQPAIGTGKRTWVYCDLPLSPSFTILDPPFTPLYTHTEVLLGQNLSVHFPHPKAPLLLSWEGVSRSVLLISGLPMREADLCRRYFIPSPFLALFPFIFLCRFLIPHLLWAELRASSAFIQLKFANFLKKYCL